MAARHRGREKITVAPPLIDRNVRLRQTSSPALTISFEAGHHEASARLRISKQRPFRRACAAKSRRRKKKDPSLENVDFGRAT